MCDPGCNSLVQDKTELVYLVTIIPVVRVIVMDAMVAR
jgi:hypothetical protein